MGLKERIDGLTDETEVSVCDHFSWILADGLDELFHLMEDCGMFQVFETENIFDSCFSIDEEKYIFNVTDGCSVTIADVVVEDIADFIWTRDGGGIAFPFGESCSFTTGKNGIVSSIANENGILGKRANIFYDTVNVAETCAFLEVFGGDQFSFGFCRADTIGRRDVGEIEDIV